MIIARSDQKKFLNKRTELVSKCRHETNFYWATSNERCYTTIKQYCEIRKALTAFDLMIESRVFVMQLILIKDNSQSLNQHSLSVYLHNLQEKICVMIIWFIFVQPDNMNTHGTISC